MRRWGSDSSGALIFGALVTSVVAGLAAIQSPIVAMSMLGPMLGITWAAAWRMREEQQ